MYDVEIWIDVVCRGEQRNETLCTLFGELKIPMRPNCGERLSFHQSKGSNFEFNLVSPIGISKNILISVEIDDVTHYAVNDNEKVLFKTSLRCREVPVASLADARAVCTFLANQFGLAIDPYGVNKIDE